MKPQSEALMRALGPEAADGVEFWYPLPGYRAPRQTGPEAVVAVFITHCETFGREFWPSWN